jgi:nucleoside-diphosphate-sugar epimerase
MHVLVLGGTGAVGQLVIRELIRADHSVVVYARSPQKLPDDIAKNEKVTIKKGELSEAPALAHALEGVDAVVSALGPPVSPFQPGGTPIAKGYTNVIDRMKELGIKRLIVLGTASMSDELDKFDYVFWTAKQGIRLTAPRAYADVVAIAKVICKENELEWTIARVPFLSDGETSEYQVGYLGDGKRTTALPRRAFAAYVVDELRDREWVQKMPFLSLP